MTVINYNEALPDEVGNAIYDILVEFAGETEHKNNRERFVFSQSIDFQREYRFIGALGMGGKFRRRSFDDVWFVDCYPEDLNEERAVKIAATNAALAEYQKSFK